MTKTDIVEQITIQNGFTRAKSTDLVESLLDIIKDTVASGETVKISGFGSFVVKEKDDRRGRNPQTGEEITIEARKVLTFKASAVLKDAINGLAPAHLSEHVHLLGSCIRSGSRR